MPNWVAAPTLRNTGLEPFLAENSISCHLCLRPGCVVLHRAVTQARLSLNVVCYATSCPHGCSRVEDHFFLLPCNSINGIFNEQVPSAISCSAPRPISLFLSALFPNDIYSFPSLTVTFFCLFCIALHYRSLSLSFPGVTAPPLRHVSVFPSTLSSL